MYSSLMQCTSEKKSRNEWLKSFGDLIIIVPKFGVRWHKITTGEEEWRDGKVQTWIHSDFVLIAIVYPHLWSENFLNETVSRFWVRTWVRTIRARLQTIHHPDFFIVVRSQLHLKSCLQHVTEILRHGKINKLIKFNRFHRSSVTDERREI